MLQYPLVVMGMQPEAACLYLILWDGLLAVNGTPLFGA